jgi:hypothetical protein
LINDRNIIPLATNVYSGSWTGVYEIYHNPLVVYYQYETIGGRTYSYLYQLSKESSRSLDNLTMIGVVRDTYLFSLKEDGRMRGLSALYNGELVTLFTGEYTNIQYL